MGMSWVLLVLHNTRMDWSTYCCLWRSDQLSLAPSCTRGKWDCFVREILFLLHQTVFVRGLHKHFITLKVILCSNTMFVKCSSKGTSHNSAIHFILFYYIVFVYSSIFIFLRRKKGEGHLKWYWAIISNVYKLQHFELDIMYTFHSLIAWEYVRSNNTTQYRPPHPSTQKKRVN